MKIRSPHLLFFALLLLYSNSTILAEPLNMTISGKTNERVELETLVPSPDIPTAEALSLALDGGASAIEGELKPFSVAEAALLTEPAKLPVPGFSAIPDAPFIVQAVPYELELQRAQKNKKGTSKIRFTNWEFGVVDEHNTLWHKESGEGFPPNPLTWNGQKDGKLVFVPDRAYFSYLKLQAAGEPDRTIPGESVRLMAFVHQDGPDTRIHIGNRIYKEDQAAFSDDAKVYLNDLANRLSHLMSFYREEKGNSWRVILRESENKNTLVERRKNTWRTFLEKSLGRNISDHRFQIETAHSEQSSVEIIFPQASSPLTDKALRGKASATLAVPLENMSSLVKIHEEKDVLVVDLRHDRLFMPGTAFLRDEALPYLSQAFTSVRQNLGINLDDSPSAIRSASKGEKQLENKSTKKLLLRSYTQKLPDEKMEKAEDPKLTATRSKVLFMLFAREGLIQ